MSLYGGGLLLGTRSSCLLLFQQMLFAFSSPAITTGIAILAHDAMAGHHNSDRIAGAGVSHGPCRMRITEGAGNLAVRARLAIGNAPQFLPHTPLKGRGTH